MCPKCSVNFKLHVICSSDREQCLVTSEHIKPVDIEQSVLPVAYEDDMGKQEDPITLMMLSRNQQIDMTMVAKKGIGKIHAKWSPVSTCIMRKQPLVTLNSEIINKRLSMQQKTEFVSKCPRKVFKVNDFK